MAEKSEDKLKQLALKVQNGEELDDSDRDLFIESLGKLEDDPDVQSVFTDFGSEFETLLSDPLLQERQKKLEKEGKIESGVSKGLQVLSAVNDSRIANKQIKQSDAAIAGTAKPGQPSLSLKNPLRKQQIGSALRDIGSIDRYIAPAKQGIADQYTEDMAAAKTASTGQASTFGALSQVASMRRNRGEQALVPLGLEGRAQAQSRLDDLLNAEQIDKYRQFSADQSLYNTNLDQYNLDMESAGNLGAAGRLNKRNAFNSILGSIPSMMSQGSSMFGGGAPGAGAPGAGDAAKYQKFMGNDYGNVPTTPATTGFGPEIDTYNSDITTNLNGWYNGGKQFNVQNSPYFTN